MTRGKLVLLINGKIYSSAEYNRDQYPDRRGVESYALISNVETLPDMEKACQKMNRHYKYPNGDIVRCIADKNENPDDYAALLDFAGNYKMLESPYTQDVKPWLSDYLYIKNMEQESITIRVLTPRDENGNSSTEEIQFTPGSTLCLNFGRLLPESTKRELINTAVAFASKTKIEEYMRQKTHNGTKPIFEIMLIEHPDKEFIYPAGERSGLPDAGSLYIVGFYYTYDEAVEVLHKNALNIHETMYDAAFLICRYPGLGNWVASEGRVYFLWDKKKKGYIEAEEPKIFKRMDY